MLACNPWQIRPPDADTQVNERRQPAVRCKGRENHQMPAEELKLKGV